MRRGPWPGPRHGTASPPRRDLGAADALGPRRGLGFQGNKQWASVLPLARMRHFRPFAAERFRLDSFPLASQGRSGGGDIRHNEASILQGKQVGADRWGSASSPSHPFRSAPWAPRKGAPRRRQCGACALGEAAWLRSFRDFRAAGGNRGGAGGRAQALIGQLGAPLLAPRWTPVAGTGVSFIRCVTRWMDSFTLRGDSVAAELVRGAGIHR